MPATAPRSRPKSRTRRQTDPRATDESLAHPWAAVYPEEVTEPSHPGAVAPERSCAFEPGGVRLNLTEWGDPQAEPLILTHGMWDHARSFAVFAPLLARHFRVIAIDARGHGDSGWASAYTWLADVRDIVHVIRWIGRPVRLVGHSKGGGQATEAARVIPELVCKLVNIDGFGPPPFKPKQEPTPERFTQFLDARRQLGDRDGWRPYPSLEDLVERRRAQNPRLSREWLRYFTFHGTRQDHDGWRWKSDPHMAHGFGPWRPEWIGYEYAALQVPMLAIAGSEHDTWGLPEPLLSERLARVKQLTRYTVQGAGHFVHIEKPVETAEVVIDYLRC